MTATPRVIDFRDDASDPFIAAMGETFSSIARNTGRKQRDEQGVGRHISDRSVIARVAGLLKR
jgi:hypothetical protein